MIRLIAIGAATNATTSIYPLEYFYETKPPSWPSSLTCTCPLRILSWMKTPNQNHETSPDYQNRTFSLVTFADSPLRGNGSLTWCRTSTHFSQRLTLLNSGALPQRACFSSYRGWRSSTILLCGTAAGLIGLSL